MVTRVAATFSSWPNEPPSSGAIVLPGPAAPTAPPELRRAVDLAPRSCPIQPRRRCTPLLGKGRREQHRAPGPSSRRPNGQGRRRSHTRHDGAQAELADDADARTATVNRSSERLAAPFACEGWRDSALTVVTASRWERARPGQPPRRSGRREAPGSVRLVLARLVPVSSRRRVDPCMRFSRTRLTDVLHRRYSAWPASPGRGWV